MAIQPDMEAAAQQKVGVADITYSCLLSQACILFRMFMSYINRAHMQFWGSIA